MDMSMVRRWISANGKGATIAGKLIVAGMLCGLMTAPALADKIKNPVAVFSGLDKITGRIITFEVNTDETVRFGALQITPRVCYSRPVTETPNTTAFVEVDEVTLDNEIKGLFTGWMFASSPGLNGVEHPVFDVWLLECKGGTTVIPEKKPAAAATPPAQQQGQQPQANPPQRRQTNTLQPRPAAPQQ